MKNSSQVNWRDFLFISGVVLFFFGCFASMHRSAKTLDKGQSSFSGSYLRANDIEQSNEEPLQLISIDGRWGFARGVDVGLMHTWDVTKGTDNMYATLWGDVKWQITNKENTVGRPIFSTGLMKGYVYKSMAKLNITTLPLMLSIPINDRIIPFLIYRHELISDDFIPDKIENPRRTFAIGLEIALSSPTSKTIIPKIGFSVGTFNSATGGEGDNGLTLNIGISIDTPSK